MATIATLAPQTRVLVRGSAHSRFKKDVEGVVVDLPNPNNQVPVYITAGKNSDIYWCDSSNVIPIHPQTNFKPLDWVSNGLQVGFVESVLGMDVWVEWMDGGESRCAVQCHSDSLQLLAPDWDLGYRRGSQALLNEQVVTVVGYIWQDKPLPIVEINGVQSRVDFSDLLPLPETTTSVLSPVCTEVLEALSYDEERSRQQLERKVERAFYEAGSALRELRDRKLYRSTHKTFEAYCQDRFEFSRAHSYRLIDAAEVVDNLSPIWRQILPTRESQVRAIVSASLEPEQQCQVWQEAVEQVGGKVPPARIVKGIVDRIKAKNPSPAQDFCSPGDAFTLCRLEGSQKRYNSCWCIVTELLEFSIMVDTAFGSLQVRIENLDPIDYPGEKLQDTLTRIHALDDRIKEEPSAVAILNSLAKKTYFTPFDEGLLNYMEQHCSGANL